MQRIREWRGKPNASFSKFKKPTPVTLWKLVSTPLNSTFIYFYFFKATEYRLTALIIRLILLVLSDESKRSMYDAGLYDPFEEEDEVPPKIPSFYANTGSYYMIRI